MSEYTMVDSNLDKAPHAGSLYENSTLINVSTRERIASVGVGAWMIHTGLRKWNKRPFGNIFRLAAGSYFLYRGISGNCPISATMGKRTGDKHANTVNIRTEFIVDRPRQVVYSYWRHLENLPKFLTHIKEIKEIGYDRSEWTLATPGDLAKVKWEAEIVEEEAGRTLSWRSLPGSTVENAGKITFADAFGGGTILRVVISYRPPAGYIGSEIAEWLNPLFKQVVINDVNNFKEHIEAAGVVHPADY
jgi:uncharacterized membrane protein